MRAALQLVVQQWPRLGPLLLLVVTRLLRLGSEQSKFCEIRKGGIAVIGCDVEPVVAIGDRTVDRIGFQLDTSGEHLIALRVERRPAGAVVGTLELPVFRIARDLVTGADDRIALHRLGVAEVILQPARHACVEPLRRRRLALAGLST